MQTINAAGAVLNPKLFADIYAIARKAAPPRFLTMRLNQDRYDDLFTLADVPVSIQIGPTPGPLGRRIMRVACIKPPMGVSDGIAIAIDPKIDPDKIIFEIHGMVEIIVEGISPHATS